MVNPGANHDDPSQDNPDEDAASGPADKDHNRSSGGPPDNLSNSDLSNSKEIYASDTFFDRYSATYSPRSVTPSEIARTGSEKLDARLIPLLHQSAKDYPDSNISSRLTGFLMSDEDGLVRIAEVNDDKGRYYLPPVVNMSNGSELEQLPERFEQGEVRIIHRIIPVAESDDGVKISHAIEVFYDQGSLEESVEHLKKSLISSAQAEDAKTAPDEYSHLRMLMHTQVLESVAVLDEDIKEEIFGKSNEVTFQLLEIEMTPIAEGVTLNFSLMPGSGDKLLKLNYKLQLNRVGKLTIEDMGATVEPTS